MKNKTSTKDECTCIGEITSNSKNILICDIMSANIWSLKNLRKHIYILNIRDLDKRESKILLQPQVTICAIFAIATVILFLAENKFHHPRYFIARCFALAKIRKWATTIVKYTFYIEPFSSDNSLFPSAQRDATSRCSILRRASHTTRPRRFYSPLTKDRVNNKARLSENSYAASCGIIYAASRGQKFGR